MPHVQIGTSCVKAFESYRLTDIHTDRQDQTYIPRRFAGGQLAKTIGFIPADGSTKLVSGKFNELRTCLLLYVLPYLILPFKAKKVNE